MRPRSTKAGGTTWVCVIGGRGNVDAQNERRRDRNRGKPRTGRRRKPTPEENRREVLRVKGITPEQYDALLEQQDGRCAICRRLPGKMNLAVDHCHTSGRIRGLLCTSCNTSLGLFGDDPNRLAAAITYLA